MQGVPLYIKLQRYNKTLPKEYYKYIDKIEAKNIVKDILKDDIEVPKTFSILKPGMDELCINPNHILKASHCKNGCYLDLGSKKVNNIIIKQNINYWMNDIIHNYIESRVFLEEKIDDLILGVTGNAIKYMFICIKGKPEVFITKMYEDVNVYDIDLNLLKPKEHPIDISENNFKRMKKFAEILSSPFLFVRIDFFLGKKDKIYFSEYSFNNGKGKKYFSDEYELKLGKLLR